MAVLVTLFAGVVLGSFLDSYLPKNISNTKKSYGNGFNAARKIAEEDYFEESFSGSDRFHYMNGVILDIKGDYLLLKGNLVKGPFEMSPNVTERTILLDKNTKIVTFLKDLEKAGTVSDIKIGDAVIVFSDEDIKNSIKITIKEIRVFGPFTKMVKVKK